MHIIINAILNCKELISFCEPLPAVVDGGLPAEPCTGGDRMHTVILNAILNCKSSSHFESLYLQSLMKE